jgi:hypothetical protein
VTPFFRGGRYIYKRIVTPNRVKMKAIKLLVLVGCILSVYTTASALGERKVNLRGNWKFILGDNAKYADPSYNDKDWESIYVPAAWGDEGFSHYAGYAWYRNSFQIDFQPDEPLYLQLGAIDDCDEVFINGKLIGGTGGMPPRYFTAFNVNRIYMVPTEYLVKGKPNIIAVRVFDEGGVGGILGKTVGIYSYADHFKVGFQLMGNWKFRLSDDLQWAAENYNDSDWDDIIVPSGWEEQGFHDYNGFAWYRKTFKLPVNFSAEEMVILVGRIDDMDQVFINGKLVGETGNIDRKWAHNDEHQRPRIYFIPDGLLKPGKANTVAVRVYDQEQRGGIYDGPVTIIHRSQYKEFWKSYKGEYSSDWWGVFKYWDWD